MHGLVADIALGPYVVVDLVGVYSFRAGAHGGSVDDLLHTSVDGGVDGGFVGGPAPRTHEGNGDNDGRAGTRKRFFKPVRIVEVGDTRLDARVFEGVERLG